MKTWSKFYFCMDEQQITSPAGKRLFSASFVFGLSSLPNSATGNGTDTRYTILPDIDVDLFIYKSISQSKYIIVKRLDVPSYNIPTLTRYLQNLKPKDAFVTLARFYRIINKNN